MALGRKTGGRKKGIRNKRSVATERAVAEAVSGNLTPLQYILSVMRDPTVDPKRRDEMAKAAAPYVHPRLTATDFHMKEPEVVDPDKPYIELAYELVRDLIQAGAIVLADGAKLGPLPTRQNLR
jgi:hypothetical protein